LLRAAVAGDPRATAQLLSRIQPQVQRFCRARLGRRETTMGSADDVAQDVCMAVLAVLPDYRFAGVSFRAFVFGIARHKIADAFRAMARNRCDAVEELPERTSSEQGPEQLVLEAERNDRLGDLLGVLGTRQVEILTLRIAVGLTAEETAEALGSTPGAVRVAQHRALQRLRRELEERAAWREVAADAPSAALAQAAPVRPTVRRPRQVHRIAPARTRIAVAPRIPAQRVAEEQVAVAV
jgi:RNA polymerase sigma-70 factor, ECF subfamily